MGVQVNMSIYLPPFFVPEKYIAGEEYGTKNRTL